MNRSDTFKQIADYFTGLGTLFEVLAAESASGPARPAGPEAASLTDAAPASDEGSLAMCPRHRKEYRDGKYGPYCTALAEGAWADKKGYCRITPRNADEWLRQQAAVAA